MGEYKTNNRKDTQNMIDKIKKLFTLIEAEFQALEGESFDLDVELDAHVIHCADFLRKFNLSTQHLDPWTFDGAIKYALGDAYNADDLWAEYLKAMGD